MNDVNAYAARICAGGNGCRRRRAPTMMPSVPSEPTNSCVRSGPTAARGAPPVVIERAVGEHDVEAHDDVLDLAVTGRELAGATAREPAADGRQRHRLRPVPARDAVLVAQLVLEHVAERARLHVDEHRRVIDVDDALERGEVEQHATEHRNARAAHAAPAGGGGDRDPCRRCTRAAPPRPRRRSAGGRSPTRGSRPGRRAPRSSRAATSRGSPRRSPRPQSRRRRRSRRAAPATRRRPRPARAEADPRRPTASPANAIGGVGAPRFVSMLAEITTGAG